MKATFKDNKDRSWTVEVTIAAVKRVRDLLEIDLLDIVMGDLLKQFVVDTVLLVDCLYVVLQPQLDDAGVTDVEFGESLGGDVLEKATQAFLEGLALFFPTGKREVLQLALSKVNEAEQRAMTAATEYLNSPEVKAKVDEQIAKIGNELTNSLELSESTPDP